MKVKLVKSELIDLTYYDRIFVDNVEYEVCYNLHSIDGRLYYSNIIVVYNAFDGSYRVPNGVEETISDFLDEYYEKKKFSFILKRRE